MSTDSNETREVVRQKYGEAARTALAGKGTSCCSPAAASCQKDPITSDLYSDSESASVPEAAVRPKKPERSAP